MSFALRRGRRGGGAAAGGGGHQRDDQPGVCSRESEDTGGCHLPSTLHVVTSLHPPLQNSAVSFSRIGNIRQSGQLNTCVTCPPPSPLCPGTLAPRHPPIRRNFHQIEDVWSGPSFPLPYKAFEQTAGQCRVISELWKLPGN